MFRSSVAATIVFAAQLFFAPPTSMAQSASASIQVSVTQPQPVAAGTNFVQPEAPPVCAWAPAANQKGKICAPNYPTSCNGR